MALFIKSIIAGIAIAIGSIINLKVGGVAGAVVFSIGLLVILSYGYKLYTGYVAYIFNENYLKDIWIILLGNLVGCCILFLLPQFSQATTLWANKINRTLIEKIVYSILCGALIFWGTRLFKTQGPILTIFCVMAFILCGADHSIANTCYMIAARDFSIASICTVLINIIGNAVGAIGVYLIQNLTKS